jgi:uncharacterized membrane protein YqjE
VFGLPKPRPDPKKVLLPLILTLPLLTLLALVFWAVWPPLREAGWKGVVTLSLLTVLVSLPSVVAVVDVAIE